jgi:Raf kinase inhibitor-like YbhB/YbcL family protein
MGKVCLAGLGALSLAVVGCGGGGSKAPGTTGHLLVRAPKIIHLSSPAFANGARIPARFTCKGADISPPVRWSPPPTGAKELALLMIDRDAPGGPFTHWALANIPVAARSLGAGQVPAGAVQGRNGFGNTGYGGPCPPAGKPHHYVIELLALLQRVRVSPGFASHVLARGQPVAAGELLGTYSRG